MLRGVEVVVLLLLEVFFWFMKTRARELVETKTRVILSLGHFMDADFGRSR